jgi:hypothetical protein
MNWNGTGRKRVTGGTWGPTKDLSRGSRRPCRDFNWAPSEYECRVTATPACSSWYMLAVSRVGARAEHGSNKWAVERMFGTVLWFNSGTIPASSWNE